MLKHLKVLEDNLFAVAFHHQIVNIARIQRQDQGHIRLDIDLLAVHFQEPVTHLQAALAIDGTALFKLADDRRDKSLGRQKHDYHDQDANNEIHGGTGHQNNQPFPPGRFLEGPGVIRILVLALHGAVAADGNTADGIKGLAVLLFEDCRAHKHGEFIDLNTGELRRNEMTQFVDKNKKAEQ